jgi:hypothetical protein
MLQDDPAYVEDIGAGDQSPLANNSPGGIQSYNSPRTIRRLGEVLYPSVNIDPKLPNEIDMVTYYTFIHPQAAVFPITSNLLVEAVKFFVEFFIHHGSTQDMQFVVREAQQSLSNYGWPSDQA